MKIAFTTSGSGLEGPMDGRFGRAARFLVYDLESGAFEMIDNRMSREAVQGAGIQAAEAVVRSGAGGLVTGHCGPKAFRVLSAAGVEVFKTDAPTVEAALRLYRSGALERISAADVEGHW